MSLFSNRPKKNTERILGLWKSHFSCFGGTKSTRRLGLRINLVLLMNSQEISKLCQEILNSPRIRRTKKSPPIEVNIDIKKEEEEEKREEYLIKYKEVEVLVEEEIKGVDPLYLELNKETQS